MRWWIRRAHTAWRSLRAYQDWYLRYYLKSVPGVAEVATFGGFGRQYQVNVDPNRLQAYGLSIKRVAEAVRGGNTETGGRLIEFGGTEYMVRGRGYAKSIKDFEEICPDEPERARLSASRTSGPWCWDRSCEEAHPTWTAREKWSRASSSCVTVRMRST